MPKKEGGPRRRRAACISRANRSGPSVGHVATHPSGPSGILSGTSYDSGFILSVRELKRNIALTHDLQTTVVSAPREGRLCSLPESESHQGVPY